LADTCAVNVPNVSLIPVVWPGQIRPVLETAPPTVPMPRNAPLAPTVTAPEPVPDPLVLLTSSVPSFTAVAPVYVK
jgi:hypothetical protein